LNPKIDKLARDIEKTEKKIADLQKKLELFKEEKTRLENEDYGDIGRDFHLTPKELAEFLPNLRDPDLKKLKIVIKRRLNKPTNPEEKEQ